MSDSFDPAGDRASVFDAVPASHTVARVDLGALRHNARVLARQAAPSRLMAVVKADAYGHGAVAVARALEADGVEAFAVATLPEALALRNGGVCGRILVFLPPTAEMLPAFAAHGLDAAVSSASALNAVCAVVPPSGERLRVHVKADTGMHRLGFGAADVPAALDRLRGTAHVEVAGVWSHLATTEDAFAVEQAARLNALSTFAPDVPRHVANSAALLSGDGRLDAGAPPDESAVEGWVRAGLALYGVDPRGPEATRVDVLRPVLSLHARVLRVQTVAAGETVSYGRTWTARQPTRIATVGIGYADGLPRALSNRGWMAVRGQRFGIAGIVCMDLTMLDLGPPGGAGDAVLEGDTADALGGAGPSAHEIAALCDTIPYEILARLGARVPRSVGG